MNDDDYGSAAQQVLQSRWLIEEIAKWDYRAYRVLSALNRKGGVLALDQSPYYKGWRIAMKRQSVKVIHHATPDGFERTWWIPWPFGTYKSPYKGPEPDLLRERLHGTYPAKTRLMWYGKGLRCYEVVDHESPGELQISEAGPTRSKRHKHRIGTQKELEWFNQQFEKYSDGPFPYD